MVQYKIDFVLIQKYILKVQVELEKKVICFFFNKKIINMHYGFHQKEQDLNTNGCNCSFIICIRKSRHNTPLN